MNVSARQVVGKCAYTNGRVLLSFYNTDNTNNSFILNHLSIISIIPIKKQLISSRVKQSKTTKKMDKKPQAQGMAFRVPRDDDTSRPLLDPQDLEEQPSFSVTFSTIQLLRVPVIPIAIADAVFMGHCRHHVGAGVFFELFPIGLCIWTLVRLIGSLGARKEKFELKLGDYVCFIGKRDKANNRSLLPKQLTRPYLSIAGDLLLCVLFIVPTVLAKNEDIWEWRFLKRVFGLSLTLWYVANS
jgi:hypothetical protein